MKTRKEQDKSNAFDVYIGHKLEEIDNKLDKIKSDTHNLNRIASLSNSELIVNELVKIIGRSEIKAAILVFTKEEINAKDLAKKLGVDSRNLSKFLNPFLGNKGYITVTNRGREHFYQRSELVDLIGFELLPEFKDLISAFFPHNGSEKESVDNETQETKNGH